MMSTRAWSGTSSWSGERPSRSWCSIVPGNRWTELSCISTTAKELSADDFDTLAADVAALESRIDDLETSDTAQAGEIQQLQVDLDALQARVQAIEDIPSIKNKLGKE